MELCKICMEVDPSKKLFQTDKCSHKFCPECLSQYIGAKVEEKISEMKCPEYGCKVILKPKYCEEILSKKVFERWEMAHIEAKFVTKKFYCPYKNCSALMIDDDEETVTRSECPYCRRLFCAQCKVAWHSGVTCEAFQRLDASESGRNDLKLMELAETKKWKSCPSCNFLVEKMSGCQHITCRCGWQFCYGCRAEWVVKCNGCSGES